MTTFLQAAAGAGAQQGGGWTMWVMLILIFVVMYFFMIRPQRKQQKELQKFRDSLKRGDKVVTVGGIFGVIDEVKDEYFVLEIDKDVKIRISKASVVADPTAVKEEAK